MRRIRLEVYGLVQGVSFRWATREQAETLGLTGWVKNRRDGSVEMVAEGDEPALQALLRWAERGPWGARVDRVEPVWAEASGEFSSFAIVG